jgi:exopolysaccharide biosynthesis polyprenyl glycosylphosphotransferase
MTPAPDGASHAANAGLGIRAAGFASQSRTALLLRSLDRRSGSRALLVIDLVVLYVASTMALIGLDHAVLLDRVAVFLYPLVVAVLFRRKFDARRGVGTNAFEAGKRVVAVVSLVAMPVVALESLAGVAHPASAAVRLWIFSLVFLGIARMMIAKILHDARSDGVLASPTLIIGRGVVAERIMKRLQERPEYGLRPVGFLDTGEWSQAPVLGSPHDLAAVAQRTGARNVIVAFSAGRDHEFVEVVRQCHDLGLEISVVPRLYESVNSYATIDYVGGLPLLRLAPNETVGPRFAAKRMFDRSIALLALILLAPLMLAIALVVRMSSAGPVLFRQERVGAGGRRFDILKFRTMTTPSTESAFAPRAGVAPGGVEGADRRTRLGVLLRRTSLDELPQLINVLKGDMSLVGPRPERPEFVERFAAEVEGYDQRHRVPAGMTGWAQVSGLRGQTSIADRAEWDNHYIENWSPSFDLRILAMTVGEVLRSHVGDKPLLALPPASPATDKPGERTAEPSDPGAGASDL